jgi:hypothetical protein
VAADGDQEDWDHWDRAAIGLGGERKAEREATMVRVFNQLFLSLSV